MLPINPKIESDELHVTSTTRSQSEMRVRLHIGCLALDSALNGGHKRLSQYAELPVDEASPNDAVDFGRTRHSALVARLISLRRRLGFWVQDLRLRVTRQVPEGRAASTVMLPFDVDSEWSFLRAELEVIESSLETEEAFNARNLRKAARHGNLSEFVNLHSLIQSCWGLSTRFILWPSCESGEIVQ